MAVKKPMQRGQPDELLPPDLDDAGRPVEPEAIDDNPTNLYFAGLPADDLERIRGGVAGDLTILWPVEP